MALKTKVMMLKNTTFVSFDNMGPLTDLVLYCDD